MLGQWQSCEIHEITFHWQILNLYLNMTMETASFRTLSPNTNMLRVGSTSSAWKIARVATGSTADISEPKAKLHNLFYQHKHNEWWTPFNCTEGRNNINLDPATKLKQLCNTLYTVNNTFPRPNITPPTINAEIAVPITANTKMEPMFWKKSPYTTQHEEQCNNDGPGTLCNE